MAGPTEINVDLPFIPPVPIDVAITYFLTPPNPIIPPNPIRGLVTIPVVTFFRLHFDESGALTTVEQLGSQIPEG